MRYLLVACLGLVVGCDSGEMGPKCGTFKTFYERECASGDLPIDVCSKWRPTYESKSYKESSCSQGSSELLEAKTAKAVKDFAPR
jgi:hypothetical protein